MVFGYSLSHLAVLDASSLGEGAFGKEGKFAVLPKAGGVCGGYSLSHLAVLDASSLWEGAFGREGKFAVLPKAPSQRGLSP